MRIIAERERRALIEGASSMKDSDWAILDMLYREPNITKTAELLFMTQPYIVLLIL